MEYSPIERHGMIGDLQTAALVADDGSIDWFCTPRFDSPSLFAFLVDRSAGGYCRLRPERDDYVVRQLYLPGSAILITRFMSPEGVGELIDFMPVTGREPTDRHRIVRIMRQVRGTGRYIFECVPGFDYARADHEVVEHEAGWEFRSPAGRLTLNPAGHDKIRDVRQVGPGVRGIIEANQGDSGALVLETGSADPPRLFSVSEVWQLYEQTRDFWRGWVGRSRYRGRWREQVERSAITLKLMTYAPTGALIAAPTAGLPELVGGERNWDYRFTWIRDASFSVHALLGLGYREEAQQYLGWLRDRLAGETPPRIMYRVDGGVDLVEESLGHFEGYLGSTPVRIGNDANGQLQLDIFGEAMDSVYRAARSGLHPAYEGWSGLSAMVDWLSDHWDQPDDGIWEARSGRQDNTYGRVMCWVAFDRAIRMSLTLGLPADTHRWVRARNAIYEQVMTKGWDAQRETFTQRYGSPVLDAALLYLPLVGFVAPSDPRWRSTMRAIDQHLVSDSLVYRYDPVASPDGLAGAEGTFSMCTFWYVDALARCGRLDEARLTFEKMLTYSNHVGLYSEEIGPTGEQLGNFPQAFSHLALINAAVRLDQAITA
ncbi:glycoside hydrolase family 15 protein [Dactylosporangium sucinum]|uniref:Glucoamylase n=1 Tax=Dactylosporangium sucinum TaxID=1424081 RepID=A0A917UGD3_9ACTN|nr:glycoside hydrolase family 15 protein [Dactylosporangium sucinum]GGM85724.1 glucoamylase [Dactylosporangium sucinum]